MIRCETFRHEPVYTRKVKGSNPLPPTTYRLHNVTAAEFVVTPRLSGGESVAHKTGGLNGCITIPQTEWRALKQRVRHSHCRPERAARVNQAQACGSQADNTSNELLNLFPGL